MAKYIQSKCKCEHEFVIRDCGSGSDDGKSLVMSQFEVAPRPSRAGHVVEMVENAPFLNYLQATAALRSSRG
jgi:hypothetical protein